MLKLLDALRNADITADNQTGIGKQCYDLESLIAKRTGKPRRRTPTEKRKRPRRNRNARKAEEEEAQRAEQQAPQQQRSTRHRSTQYTPQYNAGANHSHNHRYPQQPSGGGSTFVPTRARQ